MTATCSSCFFAHQEPAGFASDSSEVVAAGRTVSKNKRKPMVMDATYYPIVRFTTGVERYAPPRLHVLHRDIV